MNQCMSRCSSFDLSQAGKISSFEIAVAVFKLPQCGLGRSGVENVTDCTLSIAGNFRWSFISILTFVKSIHVELSDERRDVGVFEVLPVPIR